MKYCCIYLICLHSYAGVDMGEHLRRVWVVQRLQSDPGGGGGQEKQRIPLVNKTRGLATRKGEGGRLRLALKARGRVSKTE